MFPKVKVHLLQDVQVSGAHEGHLWQVQNKFRRRLLYQEDRKDRGIGERNRY